MEDIIKKWCETNMIDISDAPLILSTFAECTHRNIDSHTITQLLTISRQIQVDWVYMLNTIIAVKGYNVQTLYGSHGQLLKRYYYD